MFGIFKKKKTKSHIAMQIESKGLDQVTTEIASGLARQLSGTGYMYHFILAELDGASMGNEKSKKLARESGIAEAEYKGQHQFEHPLIDGPNGAKTIMDMACLGMIEQNDLMVDFRLITLDKLMRQIEVGKYHKDSELVYEELDGDRFWKWVKTNFLRVEFEPKEIKKWGEIRELGFAANELSELPDDVLVHAGLVELSLWENNFSSVPECIFSFNQLTRLNLGYNKITLLSKNICKLKNLKKLGLEHNQLTGFPSEIGELKNLKILELGHNLLTDFPSEIVKLEKLEQLYINNNCLVAIPKEIENMTALKHISLSENNLSELPDEILNLKNLKTIELQDNNFTKESVNRWIEKFRDTQCKISFGYQKNQMAKPIRVVENVKGGHPEDSVLEMYLNSVDGQVLTNMFQWHISVADEDDFVSTTLTNQKYSKVRIYDGLNAIDSFGNITPIQMDLNSKSPSDENELIEWIKIIYIETCRKYGLIPNSKLRILSVSTGGNEKTIQFGER